MVLSVALQYIIQQDKKYMFNDGRIMSFVTNYIVM